MKPYIIFAIIAIIVIVILANCINIVPEGSAWIVEIFGKYSDTWKAGLHFKVPFIARIARKVSLKEQVADFEPQSVITKDNVTMQVDSVVYFYIFNPVDLTYKVERPIAALENLSATTLRNIIGELTLDQTLTSRDIINKDITEILDNATDKWGIKVTRVEVKDITPPRSIIEAMEKESKSERERRAVVLAAQGEKEAAITKAQGEKESAILRADAVKEKKIREAEGEAEAMKALATAKAEAIRLVNEAKPTKEYLAIRSMEATEVMANGQATKLIVPSDMQNLAKTVTSVSELIKDEKTE